MYLDLLKNNRGFRSLLSRELISNFGSAFTNVAVNVSLLKMWNSPIAVSIFFTIMNVTTFLSGLFSGIVIDKYANEKIITYSDIFSSILRLILMVIIYEKSLYLFIIVNMAMVITRSFSNPSADSFFPQLIETNALGYANTFTEILEGFAKITASAIGGFVVAGFGVYIAVLIDTSMFLLTALIFSTFIFCKRYYTFIEIEPKKDKGRSFKMLKESWCYLFKAHNISITIIIGAILGITGASVDVLNVMLASQMFTKLKTAEKTDFYINFNTELQFTPFSNEVFESFDRIDKMNKYYEDQECFILAENHLGTTGNDFSDISISLGICYAVSAVGGLLGPVITNYFAYNPVKRRNAMTIGLISASFGGLLIGVSKDHGKEISWLIGNFIYAFGSKIFGIFTKTILQTESAGDYRGRMFSINYAIIVLLNTVGNMGIGYILKTGKDVILYFIGLTFINFTILILWILWNTKKTIDEYNIIEENSDSEGDSDEEV